MTVPTACTHFRDAVVDMDTQGLRSSMYHFETEPLICTKTSAAATKSGSFWSGHATENMEAFSLHVVRINVDP